MAEVKFKSVDKNFGKIKAIRGLDLTVGNGEFVTLLGPTGAGKTTTLRLAAGLERPDIGQVFIAGRDVTHDPPAARDVTFVFQQYSLYPHLSVFDNLAFPLRAPGRRVPETEIRAKVGEVAELLRISHKLSNKSTQISGGEMQRVAIGRALVRKPAIYLMDEPLSSLDAKLRQELRLELKRIQAELGATVLYVTHDQIEALTMASRIGVLRAGELVQIGSPRHIYEDPADTYVATRLGQPGINLVPRRVWPNFTAPANAATIGVRAEHLRVSRVARSDSRVTRIEHLGDQSHLHLSIAGEQLVTLANPDSGLAVGDCIEAVPHNPLYFAADGTRVRA